MLEDLSIAFERKSLKINAMANTEDNRQLFDCFSPFGEGRRINANNTWDSVSNRPKKTKQPR